METSYLHLIWPLCAVLLALVLGRKLGDDLRPITKGVFAGLGAHATRNATSYAFGFLLASAASLQALGDEASKLGWVYVGALCKVLQPGVVAIIGLIARGNPAKTSDGTTTPPFPPTKP